MNKLRIVSFLMAIVFVCACFPPVTMASTIGLYEDDYAHSLDVLKAICPDFPLADSEVTTREEFVSAVVMALNMPKGIEMTASFRDVDAENKYSSYIAYGAQLGLISNVDLFYPTAPVTYEQALKIVMSAAGYGKKAELMGGYPIGYIKAAGDAGIGMGLGVSSNSTLTHSQAISLIFEACTADIMEETTFGDTSDYSITAGKNIFSAYHRIHMAEGVVTANEHTGIRSISTASPEGFIAIDDVNYRFGGQDDFLGRKVRIFFENNSGKDIVYIYECDSRVFNYSSKDTPFLSGNVFTAYSQEAKKEIKHTMEDYTILYNGKCFNTSDPEACVNSLQGSITLVDNDGNGRIDIIEITEPQYGIISSVNEIDEKVYDKYKKQGMIDLAEVKYSVSEDDGTQIELGSLKEDDAVGYVISKDGKKCRIIRYNQKKGGALDAITSQNKIVVSGEEYTLSQYYTLNVKGLSDIKTGNEVILNIGEDGSVIYIKEFTSDIHYGFYVASGSMGTLEAEPKVMVFGDDGAMHEYSLAEKIKVDGVAHTQSETLSKLADQEILGTLYRVIKYSLNAEEKINKLYLAEDNTIGSKVFLTRSQAEAAPVLYDDNDQQGHSADSTYVDKGLLYYKNDVFYPHFTMAPDCVILKVPKSAGDIFNETYYSLASNTDVRDAAADNSNAIECYGYDVDMEGASFILWLSDDGGASQVPEESANAVVEEITEGINPSGDKCYVVKLFADGKAEKYYSTTESNDDVKEMKPGDLVQVSYNRDREITAADINFVWSSKTITGNAQAPQGYGDKRVEFAAGYVYSFSGKSGMIVRNKTIDEIVAADNLWGYEPVLNGSKTEYHTNLYPANLARGQVYYVKFNYIRGETTPNDAVVYTEGDTSSIESVYSAGKDADYIVQRARFHDVYYTFVYVN